MGHGRQPACDCRPWRFQSSCDAHSAFADTTAASVVVFSASGTVDKAAIAHSRNLALCLTGAGSRERHQNRTNRRCRYSHSTRQPGTSRSGAGLAAAQTPLRARAAIGVGIIGDARSSIATGTSVADAVTRVIFGAGAGRLVDQALTQFVSEQALTLARASVHARSTRTVGIGELPGILAQFGF